ncbi:hypothetical protein LT330_000002 [Penicillium expansum]|nr:hypothetical protein LT330_000002 [Penicillium expansum]
MATDEYPPYVPMPSLRNELGVMFGFFSLCIVVMGAYVALWRRYQTRLDAQDLAHRKSLRNKSQTQPLLGTTTSVTAGRSPNPSNDTTTSKTKASVQERMLDHISMPENRAELPVHGMEIRSTPLSPVSPLGSGGLAGRVVGSASPVGGGIAAESIVGMTLEGGRSLNQCLLRVDGFRSASPARRIGGGSGPAVEIGPAPSRE